LWSVKETSESPAFLTILSTDKGDSLPSE